MSAIPSPPKTGGETEPIGRRPPPRKARAADPILQSAAASVHPFADLKLPGLRIMSRCVVPENRFVVMAGALSACMVALGPPSVAGTPESDARGEAGPVILAQAKPNPQPAPNAEA